MHLTNSSIQKNATVIPQCLLGASASAVGGNKCSLEWLWQELSRRGVDTQVVWKRICEVVLHATTAP